MPQKKPSPVLRIGGTLMLGASASYAVAWTLAYLHPNSVRSSQAFYSGDPLNFKQAHDVFWFECAERLGCTDIRVQVGAGVSLDASINPSLEKLINGGNAYKIDHDPGSRDPIYVPNVRPSSPNLACTFLVPNTGKHYWVVETRAMGFPARCARSVLLKGSLGKDELKGSLPLKSLIPLANPEVALPLLPYWPGLITNTLVYAAGAGAISRAIGSLRKKIRQKKGLCVHCAYNLMGLTPSTRCPECGV